MMAGGYTCIQTMEGGGLYDVWHDRHVRDADDLPRRPRSVRAQEASRTAENDRESDHRIPARVERSEFFIRARNAKSGAGNRIAEGIDVHRHGRDERFLQS